MKSGALGGLTLGVAKLIHCTTDPARALFEGPGLMELTGEPIKSAQAYKVEHLPIPRSPLVSACVTDGGGVPWAV
jgi:hypothetical protein